MVDPIHYIRRDNACDIWGVQTLINRTHNNDPNLHHLTGGGKLSGS